MSEYSTNDHDGSDRSSDGTREANLSFPPVSFVNCFPPPSAIWGYATLLSAAVGPTSTINTFCFGSLDYGRVDTSRTNLHGHYPLPKVIRSALNYSLPSLFLRGLTHQLARLSRQGGVVHYVSEEIRPWVTEGIATATILGNPMAVLETDEFYSYSRAFKLVLRHNLRCYEDFSRVIVLSDYVRRGLAQYGYGGRVEVIPPAVDPIFLIPHDKARARKEFGFRPNSKVLLSVSTSEKRKNVSILPKVMDLLPDEYILVRVGPGVRGAQLVLQNLDVAAMSRLYAASDALLFPTLEEGFGLPLIEAFASRLPVVTSDIEVTREVTNGCALLVNPTDPKAITVACQEALMQRHSLVSRGLERVREFTVHKLSVRLHAFYKSLIR